jgi:hypothetical protein
MVKSTDVSICKHCHKQITTAAILVGLTFICPYCEKPSEEISLESLG